MPKESLRKWLKQSVPLTKRRVLRSARLMEKEYFEILAGVLQGDMLAPFLFIVVLDHALRLAISGREEELGFTLVLCRSCRV